MVHFYSVLTYPNTILSSCFNFTFCISLPQQERCKNREAKLSCKRSFGKCSGQISVNSVLRKDGMHTSICAHKYLRKRSWKNASVVMLEINCIFRDEILENYANIRLFVNFYFWATIKLTEAIPAALFAQRRVVCEYALLWQWRRGGASAMRRQTSDELGHLRWARVLHALRRIPRTNQALFIQSKSGANYPVVTRGLYRRRERSRTHSIMQAGHSCAPPPLTPSASWQRRLGCRQTRFATADWCPKPNSISTIRRPIKR